MGDREDILGDGGRDFLGPFFDLSLDMLCVAGFDGFFKKVNPAMIKTLGWTEEELLSRPWIEFVLPEDRQLTETARENLAAGKESHFENRYRGKDGSCHWFSWTSMPAPQQELIFALARDITEQKQMEEKLRRQRADLEEQCQERTAVLEGINRIFREAPFCVTDEQLGRVCLAAAQKLTGSKFGYIGEVDQAGKFKAIAISDPRASASEMPVAAALQFLKYMEVRGLHGRVITSGEILIFNDPASHPEWMEPPKGHPAITSFLGVPLKHTGQICGMIGLVNKIEGYNERNQEDMRVLAVSVVEALRRKRAEWKLAQLRRHHELILSSASEGILGLDLNGTMTFVNPAAAAMLGYGVEELIGRPSHPVWHHSKPDGSPYPPEECRILETLRIGGHGPLEDDFFWGKDGAGFPVICSMNPIFKDSRIAGAVVTFRDITARKQAETALQESEEKYRTLVETTDTGYLILDSQGKVTDANQEYVRLSGHKSLAEILGRSVVEWTAEHDRERNAAEVSKCLQQGYVRGLEIDYVDAEGRITPIEINATVITTGQSLQIVSLCRDITERKRAEEALRESEEKYRLLVNQIPAVVFRGYADWSIDFFDEKVEELTGYPKVDFDSRKVKWCDLIPEEDFAYAQRVFINALKTDKSYVREHRIRRKDGEIRWVQCRGQIFCDAEEKITHISGVTFDVTKHKQTEEKLRKSEETYRQIVETALEGIWIIDAENRVTFANNRIMEMLGYSLDEVIGEPISQFMDRVWSEKASTLITEHLRKGDKEHIDYKLRHKEGRELWVIMTASPIFDSQGRYAGSLGMVTDITVRKRAEEEIARLASFPQLSPNPVLEMDTLGNITFANPAAQALAQKYDLHELQALLPADLEKMLCSARERGEKQFRCEKPINDGVFAIYVYLVPQFQVARLFFLDITERKRAAEAIRQSEEKFRRTFDQSPIGAAMVGLDFRFQRVNAELCRITGYADEELTARTFVDITHPDDVALDVKLARRLAAGKIDHYSLEKRYLRKDGSTIWVRLSTRLIKDAAGNPLYYLPMIQDISAHKRAEESLRQSLKRLQKALTEVVRAMAMTVEVRDPYTAGHQRRVTQLAQAITREMGLPKEQQDAVWCAGTLHDLGKIYVPAEILSRPGRLSDSEFALVKDHSLKGFEILEPIQFPWPVAEIVRQHHERLDGSGYPDGLQGEEILLEARILAVADVVEAMASHRPYRAAVGIDAALEEISRNRGVLFDPDAVDACIRVFKEKAFAFEEISQTLPQRDLL
jgi:PAS domain S-box-containing protein/putative nucleotidyltransferase with HDIG domain